MRRTGANAKNKESVQTEIVMESNGSSRAAGHIADLPEQIWWAILVRLPPKFVLRFRSVCKSWNSFITNNSFLEEYHQRQNPQHLIVPVDPDNSSYRMLHRVEAIDLKQVKDGLSSIIRFTSFAFYDSFASDEETPDFQRILSAVEGSAEGLLLVSFEHRSYICNPTTREARSLPILNKMEILGLYKHNDQFKVLYMKEDKQGQDEFFVLSVHQSLSNRSIGYSPVSPEANLTEIGGRRRLRFSLESSAIEPPAVVGGNLYWAPLEMSHQEVTVYDCQLELFHWMKLPKTKEPPKSKTNNTMKVLELDGNLGLSLYRRGEARVELWVFDSQKMWEQKHSIQLPVADIARFGAQAWDPLVMSMDGGLIVRCVCQSQGGEDQQGTQALLYCNKDGELAPGSLFVGDLAAPAIHLFKQSIRRHALFQGHQQDATSLLSLFRGL